MYYSLSILHAISVEWDLQPKLPEILLFLVKIVFFPNQKNNDSNFLNDDNKNNGAEDLF